jgi:XisI protein
MDIQLNKIKSYQKILVSYLEELAKERNDAPGRRLEYQVLADQERNHFQLVRLGWIEHKYLHLVLMHFDIKPDGKIWFQLNNTEILADRELIARGVEKTDIVLGFQPEYARANAAA